MSSRTLYLTKYGNQTYVSHSRTFSPLHRQTTLSELVPPPSDPQQLRELFLIDRTTFYLAFTPLPLPCGTSLFACLDYGENQRLPIKMSCGEYFLPEDLVSKWSSLEEALLKVANILREHSQASTKIAAAFNFMYPPSSYGYNSRYSTSDEATSHFNKSLAAFSPLVGYVCGCIFAYGKQTASPPRWITDLHDNGVSLPWLDGLLDAEVLDFQSSRPRLGGVFSHISQDSDLYMAVQSTKIPVWYLWTPEEAIKAASLPLCEFFTPTKEELAVAHETLPNSHTQEFHSESPDNRHGVTPSNNQSEGITGGQSPPENTTGGWGDGLGSWEDFEPPEWFPADVREDA